MYRIYITSMLALLSANAFADFQCTGELKLKNLSQASSIEVKKIVKKVMESKGIKLVDKYDERTSAVSLDIELIKVLTDKRAINYYVKKKDSSQTRMGSSDNAKLLLSDIELAIISEVPECFFSETSQAPKHLCDGYYKLTRHKGFDYADRCFAKVFVKQLDVKGHGSYIKISDRPMKDESELDQSVGVIGADFNHREESTSDSFKMVYEFSGAIDKDSFSIDKLNTTIYLENSPYYGKTGKDRTVFEGNCSDKKFSLKLTRKDNNHPERIVKCEYKRIR